MPFTRDMKTTLSVFLQFQWDLEPEKLLTAFKVATFCLFPGKCLGAKPPDEVKALISERSRRLLEVMRGCFSENNRETKGVVPIDERSKTIRNHVEWLDLWLERYSAAFRDVEDVEVAEITSDFKFIAAVALLFRCFRTSVIGVHKACKSLLPVLHFMQSVDMMATNGPHQLSFALLSSILWDLVDFCLENENADFAQILVAQAGLGMTIEERADRLTTSCADLMVDPWSFRDHGNWAVIFGANHYDIGRRYSKYYYKDLVEEWERLLPRGLPPSLRLMCELRSALCIMLCEDSRPVDIFPWEYGAKDDEVFDDWHSFFNCSNVHNDLVDGVKQVNSMERGLVLKSISRLTHVTTAVIPKPPTPKGSKGYSIFRLPTKLLKFLIPSLLQTVKEIADKEEKERHRIYEKMYGDSSSCDKREIIEKPLPFIGSLAATEKTFIKVGFSNDLDKFLTCFKIASFCLFPGKLCFGADPPEKFDGLLSERTKRLFEELRATDLSEEIENLDPVGLLSEPSLLDYMICFHERYKAASSAMTKFVINDGERYANSWPEFVITETECHASDGLRRDLEVLLRLAAFLKCVRRAVCLMFNECNSLVPLIYHMQGVHKAPVEPLHHLLSVSLIWDVVAFRSANPTVQFDQMLGSRMSTSDEVKDGGSSKVLLAARHHRLCETMDSLDFDHWSFRDHGNCAAAFDRGQPPGYLGDWRVVEKKVARFKLVPAETKLFSLVSELRSTICLMLREDFRPGDLYPWEWGFQNQTDFHLVRDWFSFLKIREGSGVANSEFFRRSESLHDHFVNQGGRPMTQPTSGREWKADEGQHEVEEWIVDILVPNFDLLLRKVNGGEARCSRAHMARLLVVDEEKYLRYTPVLADAMSVLKNMDSCDKFINIFKIACFSLLPGLACFGEEHPRALSGLVSDRTRLCFDHFFTVFFHFSGSQLLQHGLDFTKDYEDFLIGRLKLSFGIVEPTVASFGAIAHLGSSFRSCRRAIRSLYDHCKSLVPLLYFMDPFKMVCITYSISRATYPVILSLLWDTVDFCAANPGVDFDKILADRSGLKMSSAERHVRLTAACCGLRGDFRSWSFRDHGNWAAALGAGYPPNFSGDWNEVNRAVTDFKLSIKDRNLLRLLCEMRTTICLILSEDGRPDDLYPWEIGAGNGDGKPYEKTWQAFFGTFLLDDDLEKIVKFNCKTAVGRNKCVAETANLDYHSTCIPLSLLRFPIEPVTLFQLPDGMKIGTILPSIEDLMTRQEETMRANVERKRIASEKQETRKRTTSSSESTPEQQVNTTCKKKHRKENRMASTAAQPDQFSTLMHAVVEAMKSDCLKTAASSLRKLLACQEAQEQPVIFKTGSRFCLAHALVDNTDASPSDFDEALKVISEAIDISGGALFPIANFLRGKICLHRREFSTAKKYFEQLKCLLAIDLKGGGVRLPGTEEVARFSHPSTMLDALPSLLEECEAPPLPDRRCVWSECTSREIYFSYKFRGYTEVKCSWKCRLAYHPACFRSALAAGEVIDHEMAKGQEKLCPTPDCEGVLVSVAVYNADRTLKTCHEWVQPKRSSKDSEKNRHGEAGSRRKLAKKITHECEDPEAPDSYARDSPKLPCPDNLEELAQKLAYEVEFAFTNNANEKDPEGNEDTKQTTPPRKIQLRLRRPHIEAQQTVLKQGSVSVVADENCAAVCEPAEDGRKKIKVKLKAHLIRDSQ